MLKNLLCLLLLCFSVVVVQAQEEEPLQSFAARAMFSNFQLPLSGSTWDNDDFTGGMEFEFGWNFNKTVGVTLPFRISKIRFPQPNGGVSRDFGAIGADLLLHLYPFGTNAAIYPDLYVGLGGDLLTAGNENFFGTAPLGAQLNFRLGEGVYLNTKGEYRVGFADFRSNIRLGVGLLLQLNPVPREPEITDIDGDGIMDPDDACPTEAGLAAFNGCPDKDNDGIMDREDACPDEFGAKEYNGCPDTDNDTIPDKDDDCPTEAGTVENNGCPDLDRDDDGIPDLEDACPDVPGTVATRGCPDKDGDGLDDDNDECPDQPGTKANRGCPDTDGDTVIDPEDACINEPGPASNRGCPEITEEDRETIDFAVQNVNFETGKAVLRPASRDVLDRIVDIMERYPYYFLRVGGHTDSVGSEESNQLLSERRAKSTYDYLVSRGITPSRIEWAGYGELQPIADNSNRDGRELNRRVEFDLYIPD